MRKAKGKTWRRVPVDAPWAKRLRWNPFRWLLCAGAHRGVYPDGPCVECGKPGERWVMR